MKAKTWKIIVTLCAIIIAAQQMYMFNLHKELKKANDLTMFLWRLPPAQWIVESMCVGFESLKLQKLQKVDFFKLVDSAAFLYSFPVWGDHSYRNEEVDTNYYDWQYFNKAKWDTSHATDFDELYYNNYLSMFFLFKNNTFIDYRSRAINGSRDSLSHDNYYFPRSAECSAIVTKQHERRR